VTLAFTANCKNSLLYSSDTSRILDRFCS